MLLILIIIFILLVIALCYKSKRSLHMLQQNLYNENNRYIRWTIKNISNFLNIEILGMALLLICSTVFYNLENCLVPLELVILIVYIRVIRNFQNFFKNEQTKKRQRLCNFLIFNPLKFRPDPPLGISGGLLPSPLLSGGVSPLPPCCPLLSPGPPG